MIAMNDILDKMIEGTCAITGRLQDARESIRACRQELVEVKARLADAPVSLEGEDAKREATRAYAAQISQLDAVLAAFEPAVPHDAMKTKAEIEETLTRNLRILDAAEGFNPDGVLSRAVLRDSVESMLRASAGNLAQVYAPIGGAK